MGYVFRAMIENYKTTSVGVSFGDRVPVFNIPAYELTSEYMDNQIAHFRLKAAIEDMEFEQVAAAQVVSKK